MVDSLLSARRHEALLDRFEENPALRAEEISELAATLGSRVRYAVLAAVIEQKVKLLSGHPNVLLPRDTKTSQNETELEVRVVGAVYDLESRIEVWHGEVKGSAKSVSAAFDPNKRRPLNPPPPTLLEAVPEAFSRLADGLLE
jgi:hypothetical protein